MGRADQEDSLGVLCKKKLGDRSEYTLDDAKKVESIYAYRGDSKGDYLKNRGFTNLKQPDKSIQCLHMLMSDRADLWISSDIEGERGTTLNN